MTTFSQLVDKMVNEQHRPDMRTEIASYLNQTIRECHFDPTNGNVVLLNPNYKEASLTAGLESGYTWPIPNMALWQAAAAVRFDDVWVDGEQVYAVPVTPGIMAQRALYAYQLAGKYIVFKGYGGLNATISLAYFEYPPTLKYFAVADRPATYDEVNGFSYHADYSATDELKETAETLVTNWLLLRWAVVIEEGIRAKVYKRLSDDGRQRTSYSLYQQQRRGLITSEQARVGGVL